MQCKWLLIFCLCAAIQFQFTVGYPNWYAPQGQQQRVENPLPQRYAPQGQQQRVENPLPQRAQFQHQDANPSFSSNSDTNNGQRAQFQHQDANPSFPSNSDTNNDQRQSLKTDASSDIQSTTKPVTETSGSSNRGEYDSPTPGNSENITSPTTRHICTISTQYYDCQIQNVHLKKGQPNTFGLEHNTQQNLTFQDSTLEYLPKALIDAFPHLTLMNLNDLMITSIEPNAFERATYLQTLFLENNRLINVDRYAFSGATQLQILVLSKNEITFFDFNTFNWNTELQYLHLDRNQLDALPRFTNNAQLQYLNVSHNNLDTIHDNHFLKQRNLKTLDVSFNRLKRLNLQKLNAYLDLVDVSFNALTGLIMPTHVIHLNARNNSLTEFAVSQQCTLVKLILAQNKLETQPELGTCNSLVYLDLSYNLLEAFEIRISMAKLKTIKLRHNNLFEINLPIKLPSPPFSLEALDLSYNKLTHGLPLSLFKKLRTVILNDNYLISLKSYADESHRNFKGYRMANNEWNCADIPKFEQLTLDKNKNLCAPEMRNESGICCRVYSRPYNDRLNHIVRVADFHERANKKKCSKPVSTLSNQINLDEIYNAIANANTEKADKLREIEEVKKKVFNNKEALNILQTNLDRLYTSKHNVAREIEKQRQSHRVTREGLITDREMLERIIKFVQEKDAFNDVLLERRQQDTEDSNRLWVEKQQEINVLKNIIADLQVQHTALKLKEKDKKKQKDLLQRNVNKNSASIHGGTGQIS